MSACISFLMTIALLVPAGMLEPATSSIEHARHDMLSDGGSVDSETPTEIDVEEPELYFADGLGFDVGVFTTCRVVLMSRDYIATADLDSSGCRPPPVAS